MSIVARLFQGATYAMILVTIPAIIAIEWPEKFEVYQGYVSAASESATCLALDC